MQYWCVLARESRGSQLVAAIDPLCYESQHPLYSALEAASRLSPSRTHKNVTVKMDDAIQNQSHVH